MKRPQAPAREPDNCPLSVVGDVTRRAHHPRIKESPPRSAATHEHHAVVVGDLQLTADQRRP